MFRKALTLLGMLLSFPVNEQLNAEARLPAPTYYLAAEVHECSADQLLLKGASNLPSGSLISVQVSEFYEDAWKDYSDTIFARLDNDGFFEAMAHPLPKLTFHRNLVVRVYFSPAYHKQPPNVLSAVGKRGEKLGEPRNPQAYHMSGGYSYLLTIARVEGCPP